MNWIQRLLNALAGVATDTDPKVMGKLQIVATTIDLDQAAGSLENKSANIGVGMVAGGLI